jgi:flagellar hook-associated protein 2
MSQLRISGLASGLDTDQVVKDLTKAKRANVESLKQQRTVMEWQRDAYREMNKKLLNFRSEHIRTLQREDVLMPKTLTISGNSSAVQAVATTDAVQGTIELSVARLATAASHRSVGDIRVHPSFDAAKPLATEMAEGRIATVDLTQTFSINGTEIAIHSGDTLHKVLEKINTQTNVTAFYDSVTGNVSLTSKNTGRTNGVGGDLDVIHVTGAFATDVLRLQDGTNQTAAVNAQLTINGIATERTSNTIGIQGVDVQLTGVSGGTPTRIEVRANMEAAIGSMKKFIQEYNTLIGSMQSTLSEARHRDFLPLTDEQRKEMSDTEIEMWEKKAKSGMLRNDAITNAALSQMRMALGEKVNGVALTLSEIGITTGSFRERGKLTVRNESALRTALENNPERVFAMLNANDGTRKGILTKMEEAIGGALKKFGDRAGTSAVIDTGAFRPDAMIGRRMGEIDARIKQETRRADELESRYYKQFTALEAAMQRFSSQSNYLAGQLQK